MSIMNILKLKKKEKETFAPSPAKRLKRANLELTGRGTHDNEKQTITINSGTHRSMVLLALTPLSCPCLPARESRSATSPCCPLHVRSLRPLERLHVQTLRASQWYEMLLQVQLIFISFFFFKKKLVRYSSNYFSIQ